MTTRKIGKTCDQGVVIYLIKKGELWSLWEMQDVEDFKQTNEHNNEKGKRHLHLGTQHSDKNKRLIALEMDWKTIFPSLPSRDNFFYM